MASGGVATLIVLLTIINLMNSASQVSPNEPRVAGESTPATAEDEEDVEGRRYQHVCRPRSPAQSSEDTSECGSERPEKPRGTETPDDEPFHEDEFVAPEGDESSEPARVEVTPAVRPSAGIRPRPIELRRGVGQAILSERQQ